MGVVDYILEQINKAMEKLEPIDIITPTTKQYKIINQRRLNEAYKILDDLKAKLEAVKVKRG